MVGTLIFGATLDQTFTDLFAHTTSDVVVTAETDVEGSGQAGDVATLPASRCLRLKAWPAPQQSGAPCSPTEWPSSAATVSRSAAGRPLNFGSNWE